MAEPSYPSLLQVQNVLCFQTRNSLSLPILFCSIILSTYLVITCLFISLSSSIDSRFLMDHSRCPQCIILWIVSFFFSCILFLCTADCSSIIPYTTTFVVTFRIPLVWSFSQLVSISEQTALTVTNHNVNMHPLFFLSRYNRLTNKKIRHDCILYIVALRRILPSSDHRLS